jgi:predicted ATPase
VIGTGGSGKTRLALQVAHGLRYDFPDGIFLVSLSGLGSSAAFLPALASTLGVTFQREWGDPFAQLSDYLQHRHLLLILDSFEEVLEAAPWLTRLLEAANSVQVLVTSRARLNIQAEQIFPLEGLDYPDPVDLDIPVSSLEEYSALELFHNTARQIVPDYPHHLSDMPHLARICQLVAGMPLGVVLAASWMTTYSPGEIAVEIERSLDFLAAAYSDIPERQRSLRATMDHSWSLLGDKERQAFQRLSVFQGVFTRQAAGQVVGVDTLGLRELVDKSMLQVSAGSYRMHDLLRQYGAEKLAADEAASQQVRDAHSWYFLERLAGYEPRLMSARRSATLDEMDAEINDLQVAWKWACRQADIPRLGGSLPGLCPYYEMRVRYREGEQACQAGLDALPTAAEHDRAAAVLYARLLLWRATFLTLSGELELASNLRQQAGELLDRLEAQGVDARRPRAMYWQAEGEAQAELKAKLDCYQRGIALYQELRDGWRLAGMLVWAGEYAMRLGDPGQALAYQQEALRLARQLGEPGILLHCLRQSTSLYLLLNQPDTAQNLMQEAIAVCERVEEPSLRANAHMHLGQHLNLCGRFTEAIQILDQSVPVLRNLGYRYGMVYGTLALGLAYYMDGDYPRGEAIQKIGLYEAEQGNFCREAAVILGAMGMMALALGQVDKAIGYCCDMVERYRRMQFAGELAMSLGGLAFAQAAGGKLDSARESLREALPLAEKTRNMAAIYFCLPSMVYLLACLGQLEMALSAHRLVQQVPFLWNSRWYADVIGNEMEAHWQALSPDEQAAIEAYAKEHTPFSIIPQVLELLEAG